MISLLDDGEYLLEIFGTVSEITLLLTVKLDAGFEYNEEDSVLVGDFEAAIPCLEFRGVDDDGSLLIFLSHFDDCVPPFNILLLLDIDRLDILILD